MKLKRLEIYGFKSFAQKTEIAFNQGITGIVGPNGSGKSNIGDAVRWVLGEQSAKALRGAKMEDVIFSGTEKRKPMPYCEVSLVFDNEDGALNSQFTEVMVTRRVYRSGEGAYYLNKNTCRLKDIVELFRDTGIGREGYSIIGQGKIDGILSAKGEERRDVFEEAAGIVTYRARKEEAERSLAKTRDNLLRVQDIIEEIQGRIEPLQAQAEAARRYLTLSERLKVLEVNVFLVRHDLLNERIAGLKANLQEQEQVIGDFQARLEELHRLRESLAANQETLENELLVIRQTVEETTARHTGQIQAKERVTASIQAIETEIARLEETNLESERRLNELSALFEKGNQDKAAVDEKIALAGRRAEEETKRLEALLLECQQAEQALDAHKENILSAVNRLSDFKSMEARQQTMLTQLDGQMKQVDALIDNKRELADRLEAQYRSAQEQKKQQDKVLQALEQDAKALQYALQEKIKSVADGQEEIRRSAAKIQADQSRLTLMEEMSKGYEGYFGAVKKALAFAQHDSKVHGVVAKLLEVPKAYETAMDMILGGQLQYIVTEDENTAKRLIDYLRTNRLGRTTFLPLSAIQPRKLNQEERAVLSLPGCVGVASELIHYAPEYQPVVENLLGRTLVVRDLEAGIAVMKRGRHQFSVVTLAGDVMRAGGAMTGGTSQNQAISLLSREREMKELQAGLVMQKQDFDALEAAHKQQLEEKAGTERLLQEAVARMHDEEIAVARDQERQTAAQQEWQKAKDELVQAQEAKEQLRLSIEEISRDLETASRQSQGVTVDREAMEQKTVALQTALYEKREEADALRETVTRLQMDFQDFVHSVEVIQRDRVRWQDEMAHLSERLGRNRQRQSDYVEEKKQKLSSLTVICHELELAAEGKQQAEAAYQAHDQERRACALKQHEAVDESERLHVEMQSLNQKHHRVELVLSRTEDELHQMTDHIWNTYELTYATSEPLRLQEGFELGASDREVAAIKAEIRNMGPINIHAVEEYSQTKERYDHLVEQRADAEKAEQDLLTLIDKLLSKMEKQFVVEFDKMNEYFQQTFTRLFGGGKAALQLSDPSQPLTCGIDIVAQPPGKKLQLLSLLSGGERALTAIAILFAMLKLKPTPFCILDEIEAALDEANIGYFADYLAEYAKTTQFIVVTHRKGTMERCDALYGVAMQEKGVSGMVSVNMENYH